MKLTGRAAAAVAFSLLMSACTTLPTESPEIPGQQAAEDVVFSAWVADGALVVRVPSGGCTEADDFEVLVTEASDGAANIYLRRVTPDHCDEYLGLGVELRWSLESIGLGSRSREMRLTNPTLL